MGGKLSLHVQADCRPSQVPSLVRAASTRTLLSSVSSAAGVAGAAAGAAAAAGDAFNGGDAGAAAPCSCCFMLYCRDTQPGSACCVLRFEALFRKRAATRQLQRTAEIVLQGKSLLEPLVQYSSSRDPDLFN
jgi:hypothetical protein